MKHYLLILEDNNKNYCCYPNNSNLPELAKSILDCVTNGFVQLIANSYFIKSTQNIKYWEDLILSKIDKSRNTFYITEINSDNRSGWCPVRIWDWFREESKEIEKSLCKNNFEIESCN